MYNAENRPIRWTQGTKVITMAFDRLGRRVSYREMNGATQLAHTVFLYNGYLCIQQLFSNSPWNVYKEFIWDPTEPVATRPLAFRQYGKTATFLMHDGNKNVTDVVTVGPANAPVAHYDYAPFGAATLSGTRALDNPFRFSSEFADDSLGLVYYNYRHYNPTDGRWIGRDPYEHGSEGGMYTFAKNALLLDLLGLVVEKTSFVMKVNEREEYVFTGYAPGSFIANQVMRYQKRPVFDLYEVTLYYSKQCKKSIPYIEVLSLTGNLLGSLDDTAISFSLWHIGFAYGRKYFVEQEKEPDNDPSGKKLTKTVFIQVVRESSIIPGISFGLLSASGGTIPVKREVVGRKTITLTHACCE